ncbi:hypothetical protein ACFS2C_19950 [Prauserella oleivorans]|uniref:Uncharacterized protein n=1 Tax=Prauserella oleivorans TaxID=1478153 RepID=A0ABW5WGI8_9PSEU
MRFGRYFEEFDVGAVCEDRPGTTVTEYDEHLFRVLTMNHHGDTIYGESEVPAKTPSKSEDDRGAGYVGSRGYKQGGTIVCTFRRKVMVPKVSYGENRGGEQPGRPVPHE